MKKTYKQQIELGVKNSSSLWTALPQVLLWNQMVRK